MREIAKPHELLKNGGFWMVLAECQIHIGTEDGIERSKSKAHLCFEVEDASWWRKRFEEIGVEIIKSAAIAGMERFDIRDPFGNRLEFLEILAP